MIIDNFENFGGQIKIQYRSTISSYQDDGFGNWTVIETNDKDEYVLVFCEEHCIALADFEYLTH